MKLNCRPGDLAVIVRGPNNGTFVDVIESSSVYGAGYWVVKIISGRCSGITVDGRFIITGIGGCIEDSKLRPIRDTPGTDESLTWCDAPERVTA